MRILYKYLVTSLFPSTIDLEVLNMLSAYFNLTLYLQDWMCNSLYCQLYNSYKISLENLVLDQLIIPKFMFFSILITYLFDIVLILLGEILCWSLMGLKDCTVVTLIFFSFSLFVICCIELLLISQEQPSNWLFHWAVLIHRCKIF